MIHRIGKVTQQNSGSHCCPFSISARRNNKFLRGIQEASGKTAANATKPSSPSCSARKQHHENKNIWKLREHLRFCKRQMMMTLYTKQQDQFLSNLQSQLLLSELLQEKKSYKYQTDCTIKARELE